MDTAEKIKRIYQAYSSMGSSAMFHYGNMRWWMNKATVDELAKAFGGPGGAFVPETTTLLGMKVEIIETEEIILGLKVL